MSRKTIEHAASHFTVELGALFKRAFKATGAMDLYDGRPASYMQVIAQTLESQGKKIDTMKSAATTVEGILKANF